MSFVVAPSAVHKGAVTLTLRYSLPSSVGSIHIIRQEFTVVLDGNTINSRTQSTTSTNDSTIGPFVYDNSNFVTGNSYTAKLKVKFTGDYIETVTTTFKVP